MTSETQGARMGARWKQTLQNIPCHGTSLDPYVIRWRPPPVLTAQAASAMTAASFPPHAGAARPFILVERHAEAAGAKVRLQPRQPWSLQTRSKRLGSGISRSPPSRDGISCEGTGAGQHLEHTAG